MLLVGDCIYIYIYVCEDVCWHALCQNLLDNVDVSQRYMGPCSVASMLAPTVVAMHFSEEDRFHVLIPDGLAVLFREDCRVIQVVALEECVADRHNCLDG